MIDTWQCESLRCTACWFDLLKLVSCCLLPLPPTPCLASFPRAWKATATSLFSLMLFPLSYCSLACQPSVYILRLSSRDISFKIFWTRPPPPPPILWASVSLRLYFMGTYNVLKFFLVRWFVFLWILRTLRTSSINTSPVPAESNTSHVINVCG